MDNQIALAQQALDAQLERYDNARKEAARILREIASDAQATAESLEAGRVRSTDFLSQPMEKYHDQLVILNTLNSSIATAQWLVRQMGGES